MSETCPGAAGVLAAPPDAGQKRVLVVEDEPLSAIVIEREVERMGARVVGPAGDLRTALALASEAHFQAALLDVNLRGAMSYPVAEVLSARHIPFAILTGYDRTMLPAAFQTCLLVTKPVFPAHVQRLCARLLASDR